MIHSGNPLPQRLRKVLGAGPTGCRPTARVFVLGRSLRALPHGHTGPEAMPPRNTHAQSGQCMPGMHGPLRTYHMQYEHCHRWAATHGAGRTNREALTLVIGI